MSIYDAVDIAWDPLEGDLERGGDGDLGDTSTDVLKSFRTEVQDIIKAQIGDWKIYPTRAAGLDSYVGEPNSKSTAENMKASIFGALTQNNFVKPQDLQMRYMPLDTKKILFDIKIKVTGTDQNGNSREVGVSFLYDTFENNVQVLN